MQQKRSNLVWVALRKISEKDFIETNEGNIRLRPNAMKLLVKKKENFLE